MVLIRESIRQEIQVMEDVMSHDFPSIWLQKILIENTSPKLEPTLELHSRAVPSAEANHLVNGPYTGRNSGGRQIKKRYIILKW